MLVTFFLIICFFGYEMPLCSYKEVTNAIFLLYRANYGFIPHRFTTGKVMNFLSYTRYMAFYLYPHISEKKREFIFWRFHLTIGITQFSDCVRFFYLFFEVFYAQFFNTYRQVIPSSFISLKMKNDFLCEINMLIILIIICYEVNDFLLLIKNRGFGTGVKRVSGRYFVSLEKIEKYRR